jgi:release factor glutamine methyltransferase
MDITTWLADATLRLQSAQSGTARLDCLVLLEDCLGQDRAYLLAHPERMLMPAQLKLLANQIAKRLNHVPLAYIRGKTEFYGRDFYINDTVLEPRPESEIIIDFLLALNIPKNCIIADIGTGSGALGITAQLELPKSSVLMVDIDADCLEVARTNAQKHHVTPQLIQGNLLKPLKGQTLTVVMANLPYVPDDFHINEAATHEPHIAIFGGVDGLSYYRTLFMQAAEINTTPSYIVTESLPDQHQALATIAAEHGYTQRAEDDFIQLFTSTK